LIELRNFSVYHSTFLKDCRKETNVLISGSSSVMYYAVTNRLGVISEILFHRWLLKPYLLFAVVICCLPLLFYPLLRYFT